MPNELENAGEDGQAIVVKATNPCSKSAGTAAPHTDAAFSCDSAKPADLSHEHLADACFDFIYFRILVPWAAVSLVAILLLLSLVQMIATDWTGERFPGAGKLCWLCDGRLSSFLALANALNARAHIRVSVAADTPCPPGPKTAA